MTLARAHAATSVSSEPFSIRLKAALDGEHAEFLDRVRGFIEELELLPPDTPMDAYREKTRDWLRLNISEGYAALAFPESLGGPGRLDQYLLFMEMLAHHDFSNNIKLTVHGTLFTQSLLELGDEAQLKEYGPRVMAGDIWGGFALTEYYSGSATQDSGTTFTYDPDTDQFVINTSDEAHCKSYIGNAMDGTHMVVFGRLIMPGDEDKGLHAFIVQIRDNGELVAGVDVKDHGLKDGLRGVDNGMIGFDNVLIPRDNMLGRYTRVDVHGVYHSDVPQRRLLPTMLAALAPGRIAVASSGVAAAKNALTMGIHTASQHELTGGEYVTDKQAKQDQVYPHLARTIANHIACRALTNQIQADRDSVDASDIAAVKFRATTDGLETVDDVSLLVGGKGYLGALYARLANDFKVARTFEGENDSLRLLVTRRRSKTIGAEYDVATARNDRFVIDLFDTDIQDPKVQAQLFAKRERAELTRRIIKGDKASQSDDLRYAEAYADQLILGEFIKFIDRQSDPEIIDVLKALKNLYVVDIMLHGQGWHLTEDQEIHLEGVRDALYARIHEYECDIVDAFDIPEQFVPQPVPAPANDRGAPTVTK